MASAVLDASAIIALLRDEPGADIVAASMGDALISAFTLQEVIKAMLVRGFAPDIVREMIDALSLEIKPHDADDAWAAALLWDATKAKGSGLGDRTCMALAISQGVPAITTDKAWQELAIPGLTVILAR
jgi:PIN domain nuclease of toxin-antitoxin system